ncbi:LuxR C-terminal-related transcriptional regulator [Actinomadura sp. ATCC 31491]|uniref:LuxR C-terminal-related transcriptional regulator n=1 Tax=Actinomadura luzonensis TaxID=2805427 RepID=A0ABT0FSL6_9ACTN|nr:LuxR family transcriptional regulator [Actinomadura luzonensis]MCK2215264.1 LuxR C-terminal-related transcriptional regulator [Actinomadura luzonensis]
MIHQRPMISPTLVGRAGELALLTETVTSTPAVAVVEGEAGMGKTRLVGELSRTGLRVLTGGCARIREPFPLGPIVEALREVSDDLTGLSKVAGALRPLLPELAERLPEPPEPLDDRAGERHRVFRGLGEILRALGQAVLVVEDLHWADEQTVEFLGYLLSDPPSDLAVVLTYRADEASADLRAVTARLPRAVAHARVRLAPMDVAQTRALAAAILGTEEVSLDFAEHLCERASGVPLAVQELVALLRQRGTLMHRGGEWARRTIARLDVPAGVRDPVLERVGRLSPQAEAVVRAASVLYEPMPVEVLATTARLPYESALDGLDEAVEHGLLAARGETAAFRHVLAAQAVYEEIPAARRRDLHARAAAAVGSMPSVPLGQLAHHHRRAGHMAEWVEAAERAADQARRLGDDAEVVRILEAVLRHAPLEAEHRGRLTIKLAWAAEGLLHIPDVIDLLALALDQAPSPVVRAELTLLMLYLKDATGQSPGPWFEALAAAVEDLDVEAQPELAVRMMTVLSMGRDARTADRRWMDRTLAVLPAVRNAHLQIFVLGKITSSMVLMGDPRWAELIEEVRGSLGHQAWHRAKVNAYYSIGSALAFVGDHVQAQTILRVALEGAAPLAEVSGGDMIDRCRSALAVADYCAGSWDGLTTETALLAERLSERPKDRYATATVAACLALARTDAAGAESGIRQVMIEVPGNMDETSLLVTALLRQAVARGEPERTVAEVLPLAESWFERGLRPSEVRILPALTEAMVAAGRAGQAADLVTRAEQALAGLAAPLAPAALRHARGFLDPRGGHFTAAAELYDAVHCPYEAAQARERAGTDEQLRQAIDAYEALGARWDLDRAARLARERGLSLPARHRGGTRGYGDALSPRERDVARLAASGRTNKEIAQELFLSAKTVERHLSSVLRKLGLRSRIELALMGDAATAD